METTYTKLIKIGLILNKNGFKWSETEWNCKETKQIYKLTRTDDTTYGGNEVVTRHLPKNELFKLNTHIVISPERIGYTIVSPPERIEETKKLLLATVVKTLNRMKADIAELEAHMNCY